MSTTLVAPSILAANFGSLAEEIAETEKAKADLLHLDVMDGSFVPNISFGAALVKTCHTLTSLPLEVHLMTVNPRSHLQAMRAAGAKRILIHAETCPHLHFDLNYIRELGMESGVVLNPATPLAAIEEILHLCQVVLIMTVNPGWGGQTMIPECLTKVRKLRDLIDSQPCQTLIEVDGGVDAKTASLCREAGADILVAGSFFFSHGDKRNAVQLLKGNL